MRLLLASALALAGIGALGATAYGVQPQPPLCSCVQTSWWPASCSQGSLGYATSTVTCTVNLNNSTCNAGGTITWNPFNPQTCTTFQIPAHWGMPSTQFDPSLSQGVQNFAPSGSVACTGPPATWQISGWIAILDGTGNCPLGCYDIWDCLAW